MKSLLFYPLIISSLYTKFNLTPINLRKNANGFRVLMSKNYVSDISDFLLSFLKSSKIDKRVKSLSNCLKNVADTLSTISHVTQTINNNPNILNIMSLLTTLDQTYTNARNHQICSNITKEVNSYLDHYINDPKLGNGDSNTFFTNVLKFFNDNYKEFYFQIKKAFKLYDDRENVKSGNILGGALRDLLKMNKFQVDFKDSSVVINTEQFEKDAIFFKEHVIDCQYAIAEIFPDVYNFNKNVTQTGDLIPSAYDLIKSIGEATRFFKCIKNAERIVTNLKNNAKK